MPAAESGDVWEPASEREKLNESLASEIGKIHCDCEHKSRICEHLSSSAKWKAVRVGLILLLFLIIWLAYLVGLAFGAYYAHSFATGGCYYSFLWNKDCNVGY